jgi:tetratricopeptide (TPR) repeat protein
MPPEPALSESQNALVLNDALNLANRYYRDGDFKKARELLESIIGQYPDNPRAHNNLGVVYRELGRYEEALVEYKTTTTLDPRHASAYNNMGVIFKSFLLLDAAEESCRKSLEIRPDNAKAYNNYGNILARQEKTNEAIESYRRAVNLNPDYARAWQNLSSCITFTSPTQPEAESIRLLAKSTPAGQKGHTHLQFAMGKVFADCKNFDKSFDHYKRANDYQKSKSHYKRNGLTKILDNNKSFFTPELFSDNPDFKGNDSVKPIFIVGMPRSGKTLLESILTSHENIDGAGEIHTIPQLIRTLNSKKNRYPDSLANVNQEDLSKLAEKYLARLTCFNPPETRFVVDTMPINFSHLGFIHLLFPNATLIHCSRDPMDCCLYNYLKYFAHGNSYSYDLDDLGFYYRAQEKIIEHWNDVIPTTIHHVKYEDMIDNPKNT